MMRDQKIPAWRRRPGLIIGTGLVLVAAGALAVTALVMPGIFSTGERTGPAGPVGPGLDIAVVAPVEPEIQPGATMDVGTLVDGFDRDSLKTSPDPAWPEDYETAYPGDPAYPDDRFERQVADPRDLGASGPDRQDWATVEGRGDRLGLGFDGPRPETRAEREARLRTSVPVQRRPEPSRPPGERDALFY